MIKRFRVQNYKALRDVTLELTPIHLLIGPNDSGKTSILEAIGGLCRSVDYPLEFAFTGIWEGADLVWKRDPRWNIDFYVSDNPIATYMYHLSCLVKNSGRRLFAKSETLFFAGQEADDYLDLGRETAPFRANHQPTSLPSRGQKKHSLATAQGVHDALGGVQSYHWTPRFLALPVAPDSKRHFRLESTGFGLATLLDDILGYDRKKFNELENRFIDIFPEFTSIKLLSESAFSSPTNNMEDVPSFQRSEGKGIYFQMAQADEPIRASQASDGILLVLAYLALLHIPEKYAPRLLLIEEPENGVHPQRLKEVLTILRELVKSQTHTQVILTTHSPYVVDLFQPEEVTLCNKADDGSIHVRRLSESKAVRQQLDVFTLGEIWTGSGDEALSDPAEEQEVE